MPSPGTARWPRPPTAAPARPRPARRARSTWCRIRSWRGPRRRRRPRRGMSAAPDRPVEPPCRHGCRPSAKTRPVPPLPRGRGATRRPPSPTSARARPRGCRGRDPSSSRDHARRPGDRPKACSRPHPPSDPGRSPYSWLASRYWSRVAAYRGGFTPSRPFVRSGRGPGIGRSGTWASSARRGGPCHEPARVSFRTEPRVMPRGSAEGLLGGLGAAGPHGP